MGLGRALDAIQLIHQSFESGYQNELAKKKQQSELELAKQEHDRRMQELDLLKQRTASELKFQDAQLENMHSQRQDQIRELLATGKLKPNIEQSDGVDVFGNQIPPVTDSGLGVAPVNRPVTVGGETVSNYSTPDQLAAQQLDIQKRAALGMAPIQSKIAADQTTAVKSAEEPFSIAAHARDLAGKKDLQGTQIQGEKDIAAINQAGAKERALIGARASMAGATIQANASKFTAEANNYMLPEQVQALAPQAQLVFGGADVLPPGKPGELVRMIGAASGMVPPTQKDIDKIKAMPQALETVGMVRNFAKNFAADKSVQAWINGKIADKDLPTDIKTAVDAINTRAIGFSKTFEGTSGIGRLSNLDLKLILGGMVKAGATQNQNAYLANNLDSLLRNAAVGTLSKFSPTQREHILSTQGFFENTPTENAKGMQLDKKGTVETFMRTGKWVPHYNAVGGN